MSLSLSLTLFLSLSLSTLAAAVEGGSFLRDVVGKRDNTNLNKEQILNNELLSKAVPLDEYRAHLKEQGLYLPMDQQGRHLENNNQGNIKYYYYNYYGDDDQAQVQYYNRNQNQNDNGDQQQQGANEDDYYVSSDNFLDFDGYSLKYAKCQPVQRFSAYAMEAGEYSPMVINDIVILRLCPSYYCSSSRDFGCLYDYAEYAIELTDYVRVMLRHKMDKEGQLCDWCQYCVAGRRRTANNNNNYYYNNDDANANANYGGDDAAAGDDAVVVVDDAYAAVQYPEGCEEYESYCLDESGYSVCDEGNNANVGDDGVEYMATEEYLDIIGCTQVNGGYFLRPRCDGYTSKISMAVFHDRFCTWYAGDEVDIDSFGLGIDQSIFQEFSSTGCLDCSQSNEPPYFNSNSNLCNRIDITSARCTLSLGTQLFAYNDTNVTYSDAKECSYIESLRTGTYDPEGRLYSEETFGVNRKITNTQKWLLSVSLVVCAFLAIYSCYLHHAITNLLIKSLSHTDLLPPSRYRRRSSSAGRRKGRRSRKPVDEDDEDDDENFDIRGNPTPA
ncbi:hypothetical protein IV203_000776 [Nitzschia inconspicua]|uniref:Uncharacterized protein n=1 Tax=Nitzschia inconspicua TaxID=303405 RepID=A0A9K3L5J3_9STRA|nr:hypothetical protein IV203_000776 [Nitzschia inconspicua]